MDTEDLSISYAEMRDRVGGARFGDVWRVDLTDDEQGALEGGFWQSSSAEGHQLVEEKAKAIEWRREWVDGWLAENGLIDPVVRQHGLNLPPASLARFNAAFLPVFGPHPQSGPTEPTLREELERAHDDCSARDEHRDDHPWSPPEGLTLQLLMRTFDNDPRPFLSGVIDLLAFGMALPEKVLQLLALLFEQKDRDARLEICAAIEKEGRSIEQIVAERRRAAAALFAGARRADRSVLIGSLDRTTDQAIPPHYFDVPRNLGFEDNSIATDQTIVASDARWQRQFDAEWREKPKPWVNVRVDFRWLVEWLAQQLTREIMPGVIETPSEYGGIVLKVVASPGGPQPPASPSNMRGLSMSVSSIGPSSSRKPRLVVSAKKRGKKADKFERVMRDMRADLANGALTLESLKDMLEKHLEAKYSASRDTCRRARAAVLASHAE
ncbi:hypothetical protein [Bradyrhizobium manausense]|uniref:Uncharacterized protein n=1 Tax=Bradyrhizobium manausense TaxID=989370 RepID=A0A0R3E1E6_9BRAD|nr:hypothetical protein [Bradyrhizobium manausense]KRQ14253.1 hypothetical protein AOQ71_13320 [Bradyrhizobium manausense]